MKEKKQSALRILVQRWEEGTFGEILADWRWIFGYSRRYWKAIVFYIVLGIFSTSLGLVSSIASKYLIDIITGHQTNRLLTLILLTVGSALMSLAFESAISRISTRLSVSIHNDIQADIFDKILDADWLSLSGFSNGDILNRFNGDIGTVSSNAISWLPSILIALYRFIATFLVILHFDYVMALIALASAPFLLLASRFLMGRQRQFGQQVRASSSRLMSFEAESFYNFDTIKSFGAATQYSRKLRDKQADFKKVSLDYNLFTIKTNVFMSVLGMLVQFAAFGYCLFLLWTNAITFGTMTLFLQQRSSLTSAFNSLLSVVPTFLSSSVSAHRIRELTELPREVHIPESSAMDKLSERGFTVSMEAVDFGYTAERPVLTGSGFTARPGEIVALVGPSGEGKTTLIRLMLGLIHPQAGSVSLLAADGSAVAMNADTRHLLAYVPQGNTLISGTVAENMRMAKEDATDAEIIAVLQITCAWDFVRAMPEGIHSAVGERGKGLSEGQAQRLAIARAILRDAPILLLDEATSALDVATERQVLKNIVRSQPNKTCIVTTHRPSVLGLCRRVYRVLDTRITELTEEESSRMVMDF